MKSIGIRELRQHASRYLRDVERGETIEVTDRGRSVALLTPVPATSTVERLRRQGRLRAAAGHPRDLGPPLEPVLGVALPSSELEAQRADER